MPNLFHNQKRLRVLIFSWRDPKHPNNGGAEQVTHEHAKAWIKSGHTVTLFTSSFRGALSHEEMDGVRIVRKGSELITVQIEAFFWYLKHKNEFDLVIDHFHGIPFFTPLFVSVPKVGFIHEVAREVWKANELPTYIAWLPALLGPIVEEWTFKLLYKKSFVPGSSDIPFLTVSESTISDLIDLGILSEKITVIYNGLSLPKPLPHFEKEKKFTVMFLGALAEDKGVKDAIQVFTQLSKDPTKKWQFWIVGRCVPAQVEELKRYAEKIGMKDEIRFWGYVPESQKFELLRKAHVLLNPSIHEGWGLVNLEANACGTPVVAYNVHGSRDSVREGETGYLVERGDIQKMANAILKIISDSTVYNKMEKRCKEWSKEFTWEKATKESLLYIERIKV